MAITPQLTLNVQRLNEMQKRMEEQKKIYADNNSRQKNQRTLFEKAMQLKLRQKEFEHTLNYSLTPSPTNGKRINSLLNNNLLKPLVGRGKQMREQVELTAPATLKPRPTMRPQAQQFDPIAVRNALNLMFFVAYRKQEAVKRKKQNEKRAVAEEVAEIAAEIRHSNRM